MAKQSFINELAVRLRNRRNALLREVAESAQEANAVSGQRESEREENAQIDRITALIGRLNSRDQKMLREINAALERMAGGRYGKCTACGTNIGKSRLRALPTALLCIDCAAARESRASQKGRSSDLADEETVHFPVNQFKVPSWFEGEEPE